MIIVETPLRAIEAELAELQRPCGPNSAMYAKGARDALVWVRDGGEPPSSHVIVFQRKQEGR